MALNADLDEFIEANNFKDADTTGEQPIENECSNIDKKELLMLRSENTDLVEMVDNLKQKLHQKTVEANRSKKKL